MVTFSLIASSTGVWDAMVDSGLAALERPRTARRSMEQDLVAASRLGNVAFDGSVEV